LVCLRPRPRWGSSQRFPRPPSWFLGGPNFKGRKGRGKREGTKRERRAKGRGAGRKRTKGGRKIKKREEASPKLKFLATPLPHPASVSVWRAEEDAFCLPV